MRLRCQKKDIKTLFSKAPFHREDRPQQLESSEEALNQDSFCPKSWIETIANDKRGDVEVGTPVAQISKDGPSTEETIDGGGVVPEDHNIVNAAWVSF